MVRLALFMNVNTENPQMEHCPCPNYSMIHRPGMYNLQVRKKHLKNEQELKFTFQIMPLLNNHQYQHCSKTKDEPKWIVEFADYNCTI